MIVGSLSENKNVENRVALTPDIIKKYKSLGLEINLSKNYGNHLGISDEKYTVEGAKILNSDDEVISKSDVILQMNIPNDEILNKLRKEQILIGVLNMYENEKKLKMFLLPKDEADKKKCNN